MATFELLVLVVGILVSLIAAGFAISECSKLLRRVDTCIHGVDVLERLYKECREGSAGTYAEIDKLMLHVDKMIDNCSDIVEHDRQLLEEQEGLRHDISLLQIKISELEDLNDNTSA